MFRSEMKVFWAKMKRLWSKDNIFDFKFEDFILENYDPHPHIKGKVAV